MSRKVLAGLAVVALYLATAAITLATRTLPSNPVLDSGPPPAPYQWVRPPPDRRLDNKPPSAADGSILLTSIGSAGSVTTPDGQAQILFDSNSVPVPPGQTSVGVTVQPLDPATVGPAPAGGYHFDANAYRLAAAYEPSHEPLTALTVTIVLSFATNATTLFHWNGSGWDAVPTTPAGQRQLFAPATTLGIFTAAGRGSGTAASQASPVLLVVEVVVPFLVVAAAILVLFARRRTIAP